MDYTTTALLAAVRRRGSFPSAAANGTADADILRLANEILRLDLVSEIEDVREGYFLTSDDQTIISGTNNYRLPTRAAGLAVADVTTVVNGNPTSLALIDLTELEYIGPANSGSPYGYYFMGQYLILVSTPNAGGTLRVHYHQRPSELVAASETGVISSIAAGVPAANQTRITFTLSTPASFTTTKKYDISTRLEGFENLKKDLTAQAVGATTIDFLTADLPTVFTTANNAGDAVNIAEQSQWPQVPPEWHPVLYQEVVCSILRARGMMQGAELDSMRARSAMSSGLMSAAGTSILGYTRYQDYQTKQAGTPIPEYTKSTYVVNDYTDF